MECVSIQVLFRHVHCLHLGEAVTDLADLGLAWGWEGKATGGTGRGRDQVKGGARGQGGAVNRQDGQRNSKRGQVQARGSWVRLAVNKGVQVKSNSA